AAARRRGTRADGDVGRRRVGPAARRPRHASAAGRGEQHAARVARRADVAVGSALRRSHRGSRAGARRRPLAARSRHGEDHRSESESDRHRDRRVTPGARLGSGERVLEHSSRRRAPAQARAAPPRYGARRTQGLTSTTRMLLTSLALALTLAQAAPARQPAPQTDQTVPVQRGGRLSINNFAGEVIIHTWGKDSLHVVARHQARTTVDIKPTAGGVSIGSSGHMGAPGSVDFDITAPAWMPIKVEGTYNFITIEGSQAEVFANTV